MERNNTYYEGSLSADFAARPTGMQSLINSAVELAPWWVASFVMHLTLFAALMLVTIGGNTQNVLIDISAEFEQSQTPPPDISDEPPPSFEPVRTEEPDPDLTTEPEIPDEPEEVITGDPDTTVEQPLSNDMLGALGVGPGDFRGAYSRRPSGGGDRKGGPKQQGNTSDPNMMLGLKWLADHQEPDGRWDAKKWGGNGDYDAGVTGLALLAFAGAGQTELSGRYARTVRKAVEWLSNVQDSSGNFAPKTTMYSHAIPTLALLELVGMRSVPRTRTIAEKGLRYMISAQNEYKAWRYWAKDGDNDVSVTTWCVMALKAATIADIDVPASAWAGVRAFLDEVTEPSYGEVGYTSRPIKGASDSPYQKYSMTSCGMLVRLYCGISRDDRIIKLGRQILLENLPEWNQPGISGGVPFYYYWYYGSLVMFQLEGDAWKRWNEKMQPMLVQHQNLTVGELFGSWDPTTATHFCQMGGRVYSTAMAVLTLEVYYRYTIISK